MVNLLGYSNRLMLLRRHSFKGDMVGDLLELLDRFFQLEEYFIRIFSGFGT